MSLSITVEASNKSPLPADSPRPICEQLPWDSQFFGLRIARLAGSRLTAERAGQAVRWCREQAIDCLYFLADAGDPETAQAADCAGFQVVDVRCTYQCELPRLRPVPLSPAVRPLENGDVPQLERIAAANHTQTRFYFDGRFSRERADELYATWIRRSCAGWADAVFVAGFSGAPAGYVTCHVQDGEHGSIGLIGVDAASRGFGLGRQLVSAALEYLRSRGIRRVEVVTQGRNVRSQQMYQRCGFVIHDVQLWHHLWPGSSDGDRGRP